MILFFMFHLLKFKFTFDLAKVIRYVRYKIFSNLLYFHLGFVL